MGVACDNTIVMDDLNIVAVAMCLVTYFVDDSGECHSHGIAYLHRYVDTLVLSVEVLYLAEARGYAAPFRTVI